jgi:uncharacterized membrane protein (DUF106 family)
MHCGSPQHQQHSSHVHPAVVIVVTAVIISLCIATANQQPFLTVNDYALQKIVLL